MVIGMANNLNGIGRDSPVINITEITLNDSLRRGDTIHYTPAWETMNYFLDRRDDPWDATLGGVTRGKAIDRWMAVGEEPQAIEYGPRQPLVGYIEARNETKIDSYGGSWSGFKHEGYYNGPINGIGKAISLGGENARQMAVNFENSTVYNAFIKFANKNDLELVGKPDSFSYGFIPDNAIAAVPKHPEDGISFHLGLRYRQLLAREIESLGVRASDDRLHTIVHEYSHLLRKKGTGRALSEQEVEEFLTGLFLSLRDKQYKGSSSVPGSEDAGTLRSEMKKYHNAAVISAVRAASAGESIGEKLAEIFGKEGLEYKIAELEEEAKEQGLEGKAAKEYVGKKLEKYAEDSEKEYKNGKGDTSKEADDGGKDPDSEKAEATQGSSNSGEGK